MAAVVDKSQDSKFFAGLYLHTRNQTRFWGWGRPAFYRAQQRQQQSLATDEAERPWSALADWLRLAHASLVKKGSADSEGKTPELSAPALQTDLPAAPLAPAAAPEGGRTTRGIRFVWDRKFIGFVIR
jgi:hypothetical protein